MPDGNSKNKNISSVNANKKKTPSDNNVVFYKSSHKSKSSLPQQHSNTNSSVSDKNPRQSISRKRKLSRKKLTLNIISVLLGVVFIISGSGCLIAYNTFNRINYKVLENDKSGFFGHAMSNINISAPTSSTPIVEPYNGDLLNDPSVLNIILFGDDRRNPDTNGNSDTMILLSIDTRHKKIKMLSFLRDTYVSIPEYGEDRINAAYPIGGASLAVRTVEYNFGIHIDRYAIIDFNSFTSIIDTLGGIDIELTDEEIDYINWQCWKNHQVETRDELDRSSYTFYENADGEMVANVHLNSRQALWHARNRGQDGICSGDDFVRTQRQRNVVSIIINKLKSSDFSTILSTIYQIGPMITTNLKTSEITSLATNMTKYLQYDIISQSFPERGSLGTDYIFDKVYPNGEEKDIIDIVDWNLFRKQVAEFIYEDSLSS